jgi:hypothetical protein
MHLVRDDNLEMLGTILYLNPFMDLQGAGCSVVRPWGGRVYDVC